jgi:hypothetical protein
MMEGDERDKGEGGRSRLYDTSGGDKADNVKIDFPVRPPSSVGPPYPVHR